MENQVNVFDISRNLSWPLLRLCYCLHYDVTKKPSLHSASAWLLADLNEFVGAWSFLTYQL